MIFPSATEEARLLGGHWYENTETLPISSLVVQNAFPFVEFKKRD